MPEVFSKKIALRLNQVYDLLLDNLKNTQVTDVSYVQIKHPIKQLIINCGDHDSSTLSSLKSNILEYLEQNSIGWEELSEVSEMINKFETKAKYLEIPSDKNLELVERASKIADTFIKTQISFLWTQFEKEENFDVLSLNQPEAILQMWMVDFDFDSFVQQSFFIDHVDQYLDEINSLKKILFNSPKRFFENTNNENKLKEINSNFYDLIIRKLERGNLCRKVAEVIAKNNYKLEHQKNYFSRVDYNLLFDLEYKTFPFLRFDNIEYDFTNFGLPDRLDSELYNIHINSENFGMEDSVLYSSHHIISFYLNVPAFSQSLLRVYNPDFDNAMEMGGSSENLSTFFLTGLTYRLMYLDLNYDQCLKKTAKFFIKNPNLSLDEIEGEVLSNLYDSQVLSKSKLILFGGISIPRNLLSLATNCFIGLIEFHQKYKRSWFEIQNSSIIQDSKDNSTYIVSKEKISWPDDKILLLEEIYEAFVKEKNPKNNEPYMLKEDVKTFLEGNFSCYPGELTTKILPFNGSSAIIGEHTFFLYNEYSEIFHESKDRWSQFLRDNIDVVAKTSDKSKEGLQKISKNTIRRRVTSSGIESCQIPFPKNNLE